MTAVAVLGAGAGGAAAVVELARNGHRVRLWNRSAKTLEPFKAAGGVAFDGVFGAGHVALTEISNDLAAMLSGVDVVLVCLPTIVLGDVARALIEVGVGGIPVVLNPGHTGGALEVYNTFIEAATTPPPIAEFSTLTYIARKYQPHCVTITLVANRVWVAAMPNGERAVEAARALYPSARPAEDVLATSLSNVNLVLHPPGAVLGAAWVEATGGDFTFYVDGMTPGVARVMRALDEERLTVARAFGHDLPTLIEEMMEIGTVEATDARGGDYTRAIGGGKANAKIKAPDSFGHRYYMEDFGHGLVPFLSLAAVAGVDAPVAAALARIGGAMVGQSFFATGRTAERMGIGGRDKAGLLGYVRGAA